MPPTQVATVPRGKTLYGDTATISSSDYAGIHLEGQLQVFKDIDPTTRLPRSGRDTYAIFVRNTSGITLAAKRVVQWAAGYRGRRVAGYTDTNLLAGGVAGVVDDSIGSNGVRNGDMFWLVVRGPCLVKSAHTTTDAVANIAENGIVVSVTSSAASTSATVPGRIASFPATFTVTASTNGDAQELLAGKIGYAMSARVSNVTDTDTLVDVTLLSP